MSDRDWKALKRTEEMEDFEIFLAKAIKRSDCGELSLGSVRDLKSVEIILKSDIQFLAKRDIE